MEDIAIKVNHISKVYKLYSSPKARVFDTFIKTKHPHYTEHHALTDINIEIHKGECVGIIGTNGAGKSTLLKIITGVLNPTNGDVEIEGRISALLELGAGFNMEYTGMENIYLNGRMNGFSRQEIDARMEDILSFADIGEFVHQPVKTYSSGMFVRLAFAVAINIDPEILIIDEALSVGDIFFQSKCFHKIEEFKNKGKTILFVSHSLGTIQKYCDRAILLNKGKQIADTTPKNAIDLFNKITVMGDDDIPDEIVDVEDLNNMLTKKIETGKTGSFWKNDMAINPNTVEYGNKKAEIIDFCVENVEGLITNTLRKGDPFTVKMRVKFHEDIEKPILAFTIKDPKGVEITGWNTFFAEKTIDLVKAGSEVEVSFAQPRLALRCNEYLLALGCTGIVKGELNVYHRLYDICQLTVLADSDMVGYFDMDTKVDIKVIE